MLRFQRAMLGELLFVFVGVLNVVTAVVFAGVTMRLVYMGKGVGMGFLLDLIPSLLPVALSYSVPFSWLAAITLVLGRMSADREITALGTAGLHLRTIVVPVLALAVLISLGAATLNLYVVPESQRSLRAGVRRYVGVFLESLKSVDRRVTLENGRFSFSHYEGGAFWDVELDRRRWNGELEMKVIARRLEIVKREDAQANDSLEFFFDDAYLLRQAGTGEPTVEYRGGGSTLQMGRVKSIGASVFFNEFFGTQRFVERPKDMTLPDLLYADERGGVWRGSPERIQVNLHGRLSAGVAPFAMGLFTVGMALLARARGRRVRHFLLGFLPPVVVYFPLVIAGPHIGESGTVPAWVIMWAPIVLVAVIGIVLLTIVYRR